MWNGGDWAMKNSRGEKAGGTAALMVFCIFAMLVLTVLVLGASAYRSITATAREGSDERTGLSYVWTMVKNNDNAGNVYVDDFNGLPALIMTEALDDSIYQTIIYHYEGWIYELFTEKSNIFPAGVGVRVMQVESMHFLQLDDGNILVESGDISVFITPRGCLAS